MSTGRVWTCHRQAGGVRCGHVNPRRRQLCARCGKRRPVTRQLAHRKVLREMPYEEWVARFGEVCGICGRAPSANRRLDRDHCHATGEPRGLLCHAHNRLLTRAWTPALLRAAADYLERAT
jgi:ribosomal protein S14